MKELSVLGNIITLSPCRKSQLKGLTIGDSLSCRFYDGEYRGVQLLFVEPKGEMPSPRNCALTAERISDVIGKPVVFILAAGPTYERQRLIDHGVFFVVSSKFAHLPMLIANERIRKSEPAQRLTPVAQYILLYHLQVESLEGMAAREMAEKLPYSYESITLGLTCLADLNLCRKEPDSTKRKVVRFAAKGRELWEMAQKYVINPVDKRIYCDSLRCSEDFPVCGINALSHYSRLNPDTERMIMMSGKRLKELLAAKALENPNRYDGSVIIEAWKYQPVAAMSDAGEYVDRLSLAISLRDDDDPRVEGEMERMISEMPWKD